MKQLVFQLLLHLLPIQKASNNKTVHLIYSFDNLIEWTEIPHQELSPCRNLIVIFGFIVGAICKKLGNFSNETTEECHFIVVETTLHLLNELI